LGWPNFWVIVIIERQGDKSIITTHSGEGNHNAYGNNNTGDGDTINSNTIEGKIMNYVTSNHSAGNGSIIEK
jgi:hypothetical protein